VNLKGKISYGKKNRVGVKVDYVEMDLTSKRFTG
jgi:hypothetical protein